MKISASLYSNKKRPLEELVLELDRCQIDYFHIDCNDNPAVFEDIVAIRKISHTPIDLHIISDRPEAYFDLLVRHRVERVCFQYENLGQVIEWPEIQGTTYGLAMVSDTDIEAFEDYKDRCDFVLIMTTTPGQSGGKFRKDNFQRIRKFRNQFPGKEIEVDGGVNDETGFILRILGVQSVVSGSYLVNHSSVAEALLHLRSSIVHSDFQVKDFMIEKENAPIVMSDDSVQRIVQTIDNYKLGFALAVDEEGRLAGLSSNADVRKGLLKKFGHLNDLQPQDILNKTPATIHEEASITEMLDFIHKSKILISYLPVVNERSELVGVLSFNNLIRSES